MSKVLIIGGSYAGHKAAGVCFKHISDAEITMVAPNTHAWYNCAAPRLFVDPGQFDQTVFSSEELLAASTGGKGKFVQGTATAVDFTAKTVTVGSETLSYDYLVLATGQSTKFVGFKVGDSHETARDSIVAVNAELQAAKTVALVGSGPTVVESAGEIARDFKNATVTLYTGDKGPLYAVSPRTAAGATKKLEKLGVKIVNGDRVSVSGKTVTESSGATHDYDVVVECYATGPNTAFLPASVKNDLGFVVTDANLAVVGLDNVWALGDIVADGGKSVVDLLYRQVGAFTAGVQKKPAKTEKYQALTGLMFVPISRDGGVGVMFGWGVPSFLVWLAKSRTFMVERCRGMF